MLTNDLYDPQKLRTLIALADYDANKLAHSIEEQCIQPLISMIDRLEDQLSLLDQAAISLSRQLRAIKGE